MADEESCGPLLGFGLLCVVMWCLAWCVT
eukprot:COSAG01_NODE_12986_length_1651_cov_450.233097_2_plen_28_part_01